MLNLINIYDFGSHPVRALYWASDLMICYRNISEEFVNRVGHLNVVGARYANTFLFFKNISLPF